MWRFTALRVPVAALGLLFSAVIVVDQLLGAPLSATGFFSYSVLLGARFYGMGNEASALLFGASLVGVALLFDQWPESRFAQAGRVWGLPVLGAVVIVFAAAPFWGANVGVAVWALAGFACAWALMNGKRIGIKSVLAAAALIVVVVAALAAVDLLGGGETTHLARALTSASQGGTSELWSIVARKAETNLRVLGSTNWSWVLVAALAFLGFARFRPGNDYRRFVAENRSFNAAIVASLVAGALAMLTEDSGIVIPSLIMLYTAMGLVWLMLSRVPASDSEEICERNDRLRRVSGTAVAGRARRALAGNARPGADAGSIGPRHHRELRGSQGRCLPGTRVARLGTRPADRDHDRRAVRVAVLGGGGADLRGVRSRRPAVRARARHACARHGR